MVDHTEEQRERVTSCLARASELFGLNVSLQKSEVLDQLAPYEEPRSVTTHHHHRRKCSKYVDELRYSVRTITADAKIDKEIDNRLASPVFYAIVCGTRETLRMPPKPVCTISRSNPSRLLL